MNMDIQASSLPFTNCVSCFIFSTSTEGKITRFCVSTFFFHWKQQSNLPLILWENDLAPTGFIYLFSHLFLSHSRQHYIFHTKDNAWKITPWLRKENYLKINGENNYFSVHTALYTVLKIIVPIILTHQILTFLKRCYFLISVLVNDLTVKEDTVKVIYFIVSVSSQWNSFQVCLFVVVILIFWLFGLFVSLTLKSGKMNVSSGHADFP